MAKIIWSVIDEAPALATYSLLPIVNAFTQAAGVEVVTSDISLAGRVIATFPERMTDAQRSPDNLAELGKIAMQPDGTELIRTVQMAFLKFPDQDFVFELAQQLADTTMRPATYSFQHIGVDVVDIEAAYQRAIDAGAKELLPVRKVKAKGVEAKQAFFAGPDGERIELMQIISGEF